MTTPALESLLAEVEQAEYRFCHADNCKAYTGPWIYEESCDCGLVRSRTLLPKLAKVCRKQEEQLKRLEEIVKGLDGFFHFCANHGMPYTGKQFIFDDERKQIESILSEVP
jgi:hypothetical protein